MRLFKFLLVYIITQFQSTVFADKELTCDLSDTEWGPLGGSHILTCDIFTQIVDSPGYKINLGSVATSPDKVQGLRFTENTNIIYLPEGIGDIFPNLEGLIGVQTYLSVLNVNDLKGLKNLKYLNLAKSDLKVIENGIFDDLISLVELDLSDAGIRHIDENAFQALKALKTLYLGANKLTSLHPNTFRALSSLESVSLEFNHLEEIDDNLFSSNTILSDVWLNSNKIKKMGWEVFENLKSLSYVDVQDNPCIDGLYDASLFEDLKASLQESCTPPPTEIVGEHHDEFNLVAIIKTLPIRDELSLDGSVDDGSHSQYMKIIRALDDEDVKDMNTIENDPSTKTVECQMSQVYWRLSDKELNTCHVQNQIIDAKDFQFAGNGNSIKAMSFDGNPHIKHLPINIGKFAPNLVEFSAANSSLVLISNKNFAGLRHLRSLNLANSNIKFIDPDAFDALTSLQELDLSGNEMPSIDEELFAKLKNLRVLRIGSNRMHSVHPKLFRNLRNLVNISMSHQYISTIDENIFKTNGKIKNIWMNSNKLKSISPNMFNNLNALEYVDVRDNKCTNTIYDQSTLVEMKREILDKCGAGYQLKMGKKAEVKGKIKNKKKNKKEKKKEKKEKVKIEKVEDDEQKEVICQYEDIFWPHANKTLRTCIINEAIDDPDYFLSANPILFDEFVDTNEVEAISFANVKSIKYLPKNIGDVFPNLVEMSAANSGLVEISSKNFKDMKKLKSLNLAGNEIEKLPGDVFEDLINLEELILDDNKIPKVESATFKYLKALKKLRMKGQKFDRNDFIWLEELPELHDFTFDVDDELTDWKVFRHNPKLKWISMNGKFYNDKMQLIDDPEKMRENSFAYDASPISADKEVQEIKEIGCIYGEILENGEVRDDDEICSIATDGVIDSNFYFIKQSPKNAQVKKFTIKNNQNVKYLPQNLGESFPVVESISIQNTAINTIKKDYFVNLPHLESLSLNSNKIKSFESDTFDDLTFLRELKMNGNLIEILEEGIFQKLKKLQKLDLGSNSLHYIHPKTFKFLKKLNEIDLSENKLSVIDESVFKFNPNLESVNIKNNKIETLSAKTFGFSRKLKHINIEGNNCINGVFDETSIDEMKELLSQNCEPSSKPIVKELYCELNLEEEKPKYCIILNQPIEEDGYIISVDPDAIDGEKVETLKISNNPLIKHLPGNVGDVFPNLLNFNASHNSLETLPENVFRDLSMLKTLDLSNNNLKTFNPKTFDDLESLEHLNLKDNKISIIDDSTFGDMPNLKTIDISFNGIESVTPTAFKKFTKLVNLTVAASEAEEFEEVLDENEDLNLIIKTKTKKKSKIKPQSKEEEPKETEAKKPENIIDCKIEGKAWSPSDESEIQSCVIEQEIPGRNYRVNAYHQGSDIEELRIENKKNVHFLPYDFRHDFPKLRRVVVKNSSIEELEPETFENLHELTEIDLSNNNFKRFDLKLFKNLPKLETLDLSGNEVEEFPIDFFWYLPSLQSINLDGNKISNLDPEMFSKNPKLRRISMKGNNLEDETYTKLRRKYPSFDIEFGEPTQELSCKIEQHPEDEMTTIETCVIENQPVHRKGYKIKAVPTFQQVKEFRIENDENVHFLPHKISENFPNLRRFISRNLSVEEIEPDFFNDFEDLTEIDLSRNKLKRLKFNQRLPKIETIDLSGNEMEDLPTDFFSYFPSLQEINLSENKLTHLDPEIFSNAPKLRKVNFHGNELDDEVYKKIRKKNPKLEIEYGDEVYCKTEERPWSEINPAKITSCIVEEQEIKRKGYKIKSSPENDQVEELLIENDENVEFLPQNIGKSFPKLRRLIARNLSIEEIEPDTFDDLEEIVAVDLSKNKLKKLVPKLIQNMPKIETIDLSGNEIEEIPMDFFYNLPYLEEINLSDNKIEHLDPDIFSKAPKLKKLSLNGNELDDEVYKKIRKKYPKLEIEYEDEVSCKIEEHSWSETDPEKITSCVIEEQEIKKKRYKIKSSPTNDQVQELLIESDENVKFLPRKINESFPKLRRLIAKNSSIEEIEPETFEGLTELSQIDLSNNKIKELHPKLIKDLPKLQTIDLSGNEIEKIPIDFFVEMPKLKEINLNDNKIKDLDPEIFSKLPKLEKLSIKGNELDDEEYEIIKKKNPKLEIEFDDKSPKESFKIETTTPTVTNKDLRCKITHQPYSEKDPTGIVACAIENQPITTEDFKIKSTPTNIQSEVLTIENDENVHFLPKSFNENFPKLRKIVAKNLSLEELEPEAFKNLKNLTEIDLSKNKLKKLDPKLLKNLTNLKTIDLSDNEIEEIPDKFFTDLPSLEEISLSNNKITNLDPEMFANIPKLKKLSLKGNDIDDEALKTLRQKKPQLEIDSEPQKTEEEKALIDEDPKELSCKIEHQNWSDDDPTQILSCAIEKQPIDDKNRKIQSTPYDNYMQELRIEDNENVHFLPVEIGESFPELKRLIARNLSIKEIQPEKLDKLENLIEIDLSKNKLKEIDPKVFQKLPKLKSIDLSENEIQDLPTDFFNDLPSLEEINLSENKFKGLDPETLLKAPKLKKIKLKGNELDDEEYEEIKRKLPKLEIDYENPTLEATPTTPSSSLEIVVEKEIPNKELLCRFEHQSWSEEDPESLQIISCAIDEQPIDDKDFQIRPTPYDMYVQEFKIENNPDVHFLPEKFNEKFPKLMRVKAKKLSLKELDPSAFDDLEELSEIDLSKNKLSKIDPNSIRNVPKLKSIDLSENDIKAIPGELLNDLPSLEKINLNDNKISHLDPEIFSHLPNLRKISIKGNELDDDEYMKIKRRYPRLEIEYDEKAPESDNELSCNIQRQPWSESDYEGIISCMIENQPVNSKYAIIKSTPYDNYVGELKIENNDNVHFLPEKINENFPNLKRIVARNLSLEEIPSDSFNDLINLKEIDFSDNILKSFDPRSLQRLPNLDELNLSNNQIEDIPEEIFSSAPSLKRIYLDNNRIRKIDSRVLESAPELKKISLKGNDIEDFDVNKIRRRKPNLEIIYDKMAPPPPTRRLTATTVRPRATTSKQKRRRRPRKKTTTTTTKSPLNEVTCDTVYKHSDYFNHDLLTCEMSYQTIDDPEVILRKVPNSHYIESLNFDNNPKIKFLPDKIAEVLPNLREISGKNSGIDVLLPGDFEDLKRLENIDLSKNSINFVEPEIFTKIPQLKNLDLSSNAIEFIHEDAFENIPSLESLKLNENSLTFIDPKTFKRLPNLEVLNIEGNQIPSLSEEIFEQNPRLNYLKHSVPNFHPFTTTTQKSFARVTHPTTTKRYEPLREVECEYSNIYWTFSDAELYTCDLSNVEFDEDTIIKQSPRNRRVTGLSFVDNKKMKHLPKNIGEAFPNLLELSAYNTSIKEIPKDAFKNLPRLKVLNLMISDIEEVDPQAFEDLHSLESLELSNNKIKDLHSDTFKNNPYLKALSLGSNQLQNIDTKLLENLPALQNISLESNEIPTVNRKMFNRNYDLKNVWLENNKINSIDPATFDGKQGLEYVDLRGNECIDEIFEGPSIEGMKRKIRQSCPFDEKIMKEGTTSTTVVYQPIEAFDIRQTTPRASNIRRPTKPRVTTTTTLSPIKEVECEYSEYPKMVCTIENQPIGDTGFIIKSSPRDPYVTQLIINNNKDVKFLPDELSKNFPNLEEISLRNNSLIDVLPSTLRNLRRLKKIDFSDNDLSIIDPETFSDVPLLEDLNLSGNHLSLFINDTFSRTPRVKSLDVSRNDITELQPEMFKTLPQLESVSFQNNEIYEIPEEIFERNPKLRKIDFGGNKLSSIHPDAFDNLRYLEDLNFNGNDCINGAYNQASLAALKIDLRRRCKPPHYHYQEEERDEVDAIPSWGVVESLNAHHIPRNEESNEIDVGNQVKYYDNDSVDCDIIEEYSALARENVETCKIGRDKKVKPEWTVEDSPRTKRVKRFVVDGNEHVSKFPKNLKQSFPELMEIEISNTPLEEIEPESLRDLHKLKSLKLPMNSIKYLDSNIFDRTPNLQNLHLNDNNLRHIDENAFKNVPKLSNLDLSNNKLPKVSKDMFKHSPELKTINLSNNDLNHVESEMFKKNPKLYSIDLSGNSISSIDPDAFDRLPALFNLDLTRNDCIDRKFGTSSINPFNIKTVISEHCKPHKSLRDDLQTCQNLVESCKREIQSKPLELRANNEREMETLKDALRKSDIEKRQLNMQLKSLQSELASEKELRRKENEKLYFFELEVKKLKKSCTRVDESHNFLIDMECDFIESFNDYSCDARNMRVRGENSTLENVHGDHKRGKRNSDVTSLTIRDQNIKFLPNDIAKFFPNLRELKVDNSNLSKLTKAPLQSLPQLTHLVINNNNIGEIDPTTFIDLPQLESIDLSRNYIEELPEKLFEHLPNLKELNLAENMLTQLPQSILPKVNNLKRFNANNNPFDFIDPRLIKKLQNAEVIDLQNSKCVDDKFVKNEIGDIKKLIGEISLHCINDDISEDKFCPGRKF